MNYFIIFPHLSAVTTTKENFVSVIGSNFATAASATRESASSLSLGQNVIWNVFAKKDGRPII